MLKPEKFVIRAYKDLGRQLGEPKKLYNISLIDSRLYILVDLLRQYHLWDNVHDQLLRHSQPDRNCSLQRDIVTGVHQSGSMPVHEKVYLQFLTSVHAFSPYESNKIIHSSRPSTIFGPPFETFSAFFASLVY